VKRRGWIVLAAVAGIAAILAALLRPKPLEEFPLADLVPADAVFYGGFSDPRKLEDLAAKISSGETRELLRRMESARPHLAGAVAVYLDRDLDWVFLARLTRASALVAGGEVENGAYIAARTPAALARHKARKGALADLPDFRALRSRFFLNVEALNLRSRGRDFSAVGFELESGPSWVVRGRALYRGGLFRMYLEQYVHAPRHGALEGAGPIQATLVDHFPRIWEEVVHGLSQVDREKAEHEARVLSRDLLKGRSLREFLAKLGPSWGFALAPTAHSVPALVVWIDLPDDATRLLLFRLLHRAANDAIKLSRDHGQAPAFDLTAEGSVWRITFPWAAALRLGEGFTPAYTFGKNRFIFSTCASVLTSPPVVAGDGHVTLTLEVASAVEALRSLIPFFADGAFRTEAERDAIALQSKVVTPAALEALKRQFPNPSDLAVHLEKQKAQFEARALEEISQTPRYREELQRMGATINAWAERFSWINRAAFSGRFTGDGLQFEIRIN
jgi:hypothetical protein